MMPGHRCRKALIHPSNLQANVRLREAEHGPPTGAIRLKSLIANHHALRLATPEYSGGDIARMPSKGRTARPGVTQRARRIFGGKTARNLLVALGPIRRHPTADRTASVTR